MGRNPDIEFWCARLIPKFGANLTFGPYFVKKMCFSSTAAAGFDIYFKLYLSRSGLKHVRKRGISSCFRFILEYYAQSRI